ncbi:MAG TPA: hypothetical protein DCQ64_20685 [Candidatus Rokubacteria bacterium]|nr:hypothetical protein [Candidatus Rokubacteria bacterium]
MAGMSAPEANQQTAVSNFQVTADATFPVFVAKGTVVVESGSATFQANIATSATAFTTFSLINLGTAGSGTTVVAGPNNTDVATNGGVAITALVPSHLTVVSAAKTLTDGQVLGFHWNEATTDVANADVTVSVRYTQASSPSVAG